MADTGEQVQLSKEQYELLMKQAENQEQLLQTLVQMQAQMNAMQEQMKMFAMHFGQMYAAQSIEETLQAMGALGRQEMQAKACTVYSVDAFDSAKLFTAGADGDRRYFSPEENSFLAQAIQSKEPLIIQGQKEGENILAVPLENQNGEVIGLATVQGKDGGFSQQDIDAFSLQGGKIGNAFRIGLENKFLHQKAITDNLTHLMNRDGMNEFIRKEVYPRLIHDEPVSVIVFDIDKFKRFNDTYGHDVGDMCLKQVADTLSSHIRQSPDNGVFRWGGEEMVLILPADEERAAEIAERLRKTIEAKPLAVSETEHTNITVSGGIAQIRSKASLELDRDKTLEEFQNAFERADAALYQAKENGRNQVVRADGQSPVKEQKSEKERNVNPMAIPAHGIYERETAQTIEDCEYLLEALQIDEALQKRAEEYLQQHGNWSDISASIQEAYCNTAKAIVAEYCPALTVSFEAQGYDTLISLTDASGKATVQYEGQSTDELVRALTKDGGVLVAATDEAYGQVTMIPTQAFIKQLDKSFKDSDFSISDYAKEMIESQIDVNSSATVTLQMDDTAGMSLLLDYSDSQGVMELPESLLADKIKDRLIREAFPQITGSEQFVQRFADYAERFRNEHQQHGQETDMSLPADLVDFQMKFGDFYDIRDMQEVTETEEDFRHRMIQGTSQALENISKGDTQELENFRDIIQGLTEHQMPEDQAECNALAEKLLARLDALSPAPQKEQEQPLAARTMYTREIYDKETKLAKDIIEYIDSHAAGQLGDLLGSHSFDSQKNIAALAEMLEHEPDRDSVMRFVDKIGKKDIMNSAVRDEWAENLMYRIAGIQQEQMEMLGQHKYTPEECQELTVQRAIYNHTVPLVKFGEYTAFNKEEGDVFRSLLMKGEEPLALLTVSKDIKAAMVDLQYDAPDKMNAKELAQLADAYEEPLKAAFDLSVEFPESYEELDFLDVDPKKNVVKDGNIYRIGFDEADLDTILTRIGLTQDTGNLDIFVADDMKTIIVDFVDSSRSAEVVPLAFTERDMLHDTIAAFEREAKALEQSAYQFPEGVYDTIRDMGSNEHVTLDGYLGDAVMVITKDADYDTNRNRIVMDMVGAEEMNLVTVDFQMNGKSIASTYDIHVSDLESVLTDIRNGDTGYLVDESRPLEEIVKAEHIMTKAELDKEGFQLSQDINAFAVKNYLNDLIHPDDFGKVNGVRTFSQNPEQRDTLLALEAAVERLDADGSAEAARLIDALQTHREHLAEHRLQHHMDDAERLTLAVYDVTRDGFPSARYGDVEAQRRETSEGYTVGITKGGKPAAEITFRTEAKTASVSFERGLDSRSEQRISKDFREIATDNGYKIHNPPRQQARE